MSHMTHPQTDNASKFIHGIKDEALGRVLSVFERGQQELERKYPGEDVFHSLAERSLQILRKQINHIFKAHSLPLGSDDNGDGHRSLTIGLTHPPQLSSSDDSGSKSDLDLDANSHLTPTFSQALNCKGGDKYRVTIEQDFDQGVEPESHLTEIGTIFIGISLLDLRDSYSDLGSET